MAHASDTTFNNKRKTARREVETLCVKPKKKCSRQLITYNKKKSTHSLGRRGVAGTTYVKSDKTTSPGQS